ncbi:MAG: hypothetical protein R3E87_14945 [Burkholderiaceae bacterium]
MHIEKLEDDNAYLRKQIDQAMGPEGPTYFIDNDLINGLTTRPLSAPLGVSARLHHWKVTMSVRNDKHVEIYWNGIGRMKPEHFNAQLMISPASSNLLRLYPVVEV